jgi:hypothetical protein
MVTWSVETSGAAESWSKTTSGAGETWTAVDGASQSWSKTTGDVALTWTATASHTTNRNTSRFVLLSTVVYDDVYVNVAPTYRTQTDQRGPSFVWTTDDPVSYTSDGYTLV